VFQISRVFHLTHVVDDLEATVSWYEDVLGAQTLSSPMRGPTGGNICLLLVADLVVLPMSPAADDLGTARFRQRFGQHLHSLAWFVEDAADLVNTLEARGLSLRDEYGRPLDGIDHEIWTPPRQAPCLLEFFRSPTEAGPGTGAGLPRDPRFDPDWTPAAWAEHPLGIRETACLTVVTAEPERASAFFTGALHGKVIAEVGETDWATSSTFVQVGDFTVIEVARPLNETSRAGIDLAANGEILHAATFLVPDLRAAGDYLESKGMRVERPGPHALTVNSEDSFGLLLRFTDRPVTAW
jgi:catechol 2,3-dioxygenase-like lactoylglutathione lyase family enzyme